MIEYELAKELKDAGFPSKYDEWECDECGSPVVTSEKDKPCKNCGWHGWSKVDIVFRAPSLSELIEACGEKGAGFKLSWKPEFKNWKAVLYHQGKAIDGNGSTPEEAVAHLYIALHPLTP